MNTGFKRIESGVDIEVDLSEERESCFNRFLVLRYCSSDESSEHSLG